MSDHGAGPGWALEYTRKRIEEGHHVHVNTPGCPAGSCRGDCPHEEHQGLVWEPVGPDTFDGEGR